MRRLKDELLEAKSHLAQVVLRGVIKVGDKAKSLKAMINEWTSEGIQKT
jgi:hypothetical protein